MQRPLLKIVCFLFLALEQAGSPPNLQRERRYNFEKISIKLKKSEK